MKVLYIVNTLSQGGAEQQLYYLLKHLRPVGKVVSLAPGGYWGGPLRDLGYDVIELPRAGSFDLNRLRALRRLIDTEQPDVVHVFMDGVPGAYGRLATRLARHPQVLVGVRNHPARDPHWYALLRRYLLNGHVRFVVSNALSSQEYMIAQEGLDTARARYIPNGLELERFAPSADPARKNLLPPDWRDKVIVGTVGALAERKAPEVFVQVARAVTAQTDTVRFVHTGAGHLRGMVEGLAREMNVTDKILFLGSRQDVPQVLQAFDVFLMTSRNEGTPNAALEAMATGLPCVLTDTGDCRDLIDEGVSGMIAPVGDVNALAGHVLRLADDTALRQRMGQVAQQRVQPYAVQTMAAAYGALYEEMLRGTDGNRRT